MNKKMQERSKYLSYILRHKPEEVKSKLDEYGWLPVKDLIENSDFTRDELIDYKATHVTVPFELAYLEGQAIQDYLHDIKLAQEHAKINRETIAKQILKYAKLTGVDFQNMLNALKQSYKLQSTVLCSRFS